MDVAGWRAAHRLAELIAKKGEEGDPLARALAVIDAQPRLVPYLARSYDRRFNQRRKK